jgi:methionyl-tRNA synthetase
VGHLHSLVTADILARFRRLTHPLQPVHFLTGTDEHGLKIQKAARDQGLGEKEFCDSISERFRVGSFSLHLGFHCILVSSFSDGEVRLWDDMTDLFRALQDLAKKANISHTRFIRTTEQAHRAAVMHLWVCFFFLVI